LVDRLGNPPAIGQGHVTDFLAYGSLFVGNIADVFVVAGVGLVCLNLASPRPGENHRVRNAQP
ncbi:signal peptidase II, partial [Burkholderia multivorans]